MPMTVSPDKKHLYAVVRSQPFRVISYEIDAATGKLTEKAVAALPDSMPYVSTDGAGRTLFTSSYGGDKIAVHPIGADGLVTAPVTQVILTGRHAHCIIPDRTSKFVYATNTGSDVILQFSFDAKKGMLKPSEPAAVKTKAGTGPRHMIISPDNKYLYAVTELTGNVIQFRINQSNGTLTQVDMVNSVPANSGLKPGVILPPLPPGAATSSGSTSPAPVDTTPRIWAADIQMTPDTKFVYTTERTQSKLAQFTRNAATGKLTFVRQIDTVKQPRGIRIHPSGKYLIASGEKSDKIAVYAIDGATGDLKEVGQYPVDAGANWVEIVDVK
jgi:6-phosphogluconolactonase